MEEHCGGDVYELAGLCRRCDLRPLRAAERSFVALDAKTGAIRWATEGREGWHASVLLTPSHLIYLTNSADFIVARRNTSTFAIERRYNLADAEIFAMPVLLGADKLVRDARGLIRLTAAR